MSCGARLAIFAVFTAAFFPSGGQNVVFALYLIGIVTAVLTAFILRKTLLKADLSPFILELPPYHLPTFRALLFQTWHRLKDFIFRAGKLIIPICILIGTLNAIYPNHKDSVLAMIGKTVTPLFAPLGIQQNNWPATVGLVTGVLAKEVVVGTLNTLYLQESGVSAPVQKLHILEGLKNAGNSVLVNLADLKTSLSNPVLASVPDHTVNHQIYGIMYNRFGDRISAFAYLLFVLLYFPCASATAAMQKELSSRWTWFSVLWTTGIAYCIAVLFYQMMTIRLHPLASMIWIISIISVFLLTLYCLQKWSVNFKKGAAT
jgi:ferrous iron transport protein B